MFASAKMSGILSAMGILVVLTGCDLSRDTFLSSEESVPQIEVVLKVNVIESHPSDSVYETFSCFGTVKPTRSTFLSFAKGGQVEEVLKDLGEEVEADEKLAELDQQEIEDRLKELQESTESARARLSRLNPNSRSSSTQGQITRLNQQIASLEEQQRELEREQEKGTITAPFAGIIAERNVDVGNVLPAGRPAFKLVDDASPVIELQVTSDLAEKVVAGQQAWLSNNEKLVEAEVANISPELSPASLTQSLTLNVIDDDPNQRWLFGDTVEVRFWIPSEETGFWLPYSALQSEYNGLWAVHVVQQRDGRQVVVRKAVEIAELFDDRALVRGAIAEGDLIIADGSNRVVPGQQVTTEVVPYSLGMIGPPESHSGATESTE